MMDPFIVGPLDPKVGPLDPNVGPLIQGKMSNGMVSSGRLEILDSPWCSVRARYTLDKNIKFLKNVIK
jgi:hypothetical protein